MATDGMNKVIELKFKRKLMSKSLDTSIHIDFEFHIKTKYTTHSGSVNQLGVNSNTHTRFQLGFGKATAFTYNNKKEI